MTSVLLTIAYLHHLDLKSSSKVRKVTHKNPKNNTISFESDIIFCSFKKKPCIQISIKILNKEKVL